MRPPAPRRPGRPRSGEEPSRTPESGAAPAAPGESETPPEGVPARGRSLRVQGARRAPLDPGARTPSQGVDTFARGGFFSRRAPAEPGPPAGPEVATTSHGARGDGGAGRREDEGAAAQGAVRGPAGPVPSVLSRLLGRSPSASPHPRTPAASRGPQASELAHPIGQADAAQVLGPSAESPTSDFADRLRERERARRSYRMRTAALGAGGVVAIVFLVWLLLFSPVFALDAGSVAVEGAQSDESVASQARAAADPYVGTPLPRVATSKIEASIEENARIESAEALRAWPNGLRISLVLRKAVMAEASGGGYTLVDASGVAFSTTGERPDSLPLVELPESEGRAEAAADALVVWNALGKVLQPQVGSMRADGATVSFTLVSGASVVWGTPEDNALKAKVLEVLVAQRGASVYDVSAPAHPVTS